jgi:hypothetical protein
MYAFWISYYLKEDTPELIDDYASSIKNAKLSKCNPTRWWYCRARYLFLI